MEALFAFSKTKQEVGKKIATGESNWDYYAVEYPSSKKSPYCYSVAKPDSGAGTTCFGDLRHICNLIRQDTWDGEFTPYGKEVMTKYGYEDILNQYEKEKEYEVLFYDTSRWYGKVLRKVIVNAKSKSLAYTKAYAIRNRENGECGDVTIKKLASAV